MIIAIVIYLICLVLSWLGFRKWHIDTGIEAGGIEIVFCIVPIVNFCAVIALLISGSCFTKINWDKFFLIKK